MFLYNNVIIRPFLIQRGLLKNPNELEEQARIQNPEDEEVLDGTNGTEKVNEGFIA